MPPKRRADTVLEEEPPAKRRTRSSGKPNPLPVAGPSKSKPASKARRAQSSTQKRAKEAKGDEEGVENTEHADVALPVQQRTRTRSKPQPATPATDTALSNEIDIARPSEAPPTSKPRGRLPRKTVVTELPVGVEATGAPPKPKPRGRQPKKVTEPPAAEPASSKTDKPSNLKRNVTQVKKRARSPTVEVVIQKRSGRVTRGQPEQPLLEDIRTEIDEPASATPPISPKKGTRNAAPGKKQSSRGTKSDAKISETAATNVTRTTRSRNAKGPVQATTAGADDASTSAIPTAKRKPNRLSKKPVSSIHSSPRLPCKESPDEPSTDVHSGDEPDALENDRESLFGDVPDDDGLENAQEEQVVPLARNGPPDEMPLDMQSSFSICQRAMLKNLKSHTTEVYLEESTNSIAIQEFTDLIDGTVLRAEGNSCLVLGPRGSGKSKIIDGCLEKVMFTKPIILRLSGWVQTTDRHALREIAFQLLQQTGTSLLPDSDIDALNPETNEDPEEEENPFLDHAADEPTITLPPSSHLHALIPVLLTLSRPVIVILDAFDLFALHPRQSLLYCLLDTVQSCRAGAENRGLAVIGVTSRVDTVQLLEKRVKSRFSGRTIRTAPPTTFEEYMSSVRAMLTPSHFLDDDDEEMRLEWNERWQPSVEKFLADKRVINIFKETYSITRNLKVISRILTSSVVKLSPSRPYLTHDNLVASVGLQRSRPYTIHLTNLSYPWLCLLIASAHADTAGHVNFTFEMLHNYFRKQLKDSASAPVMVNGGNIGMMRCTRAVLMNAFEEMIAAKIFVCSVAPASTVAKEFLKYRCVVSHREITTVIDSSGLTNLKKWLHKQTT